MGEGLGDGGVSIRGNGGVRHRYLCLGPFHLMNPPGGVGNTYDTSMFGPLG